MATPKTTDSGAHRRETTFDEDDRHQVAVLNEVLFFYPEAMTLDELVRHMNRESKKLPDIDRTQRAVKELTACGLLHRVGDDEFVRPTRAAARYFDLLGGPF